MKRFIASLIAIMLVVVGGTALQVNSWSHFLIYSPERDRLEAELTQVDISQFQRKVTIDLVATEQFPTCVGVVNRCGTGYAVVRQVGVGFTFADGRVVIDLADTGP